MAFKNCTMGKRYTYKNAVVYIITPENSISNIYKATEMFLKKVLVEQKRSLEHDNSNKTRSIKKK